MEIKNWTEEEQLEYGERICNKFIQFFETSFQIHEELTKEYRNNINGQNHIVFRAFRDQLAKKLNIKYKYKKWKISINFGYEFELRGKNIYKWTIYSPRFYGINKSNLNSICLYIYRNQDGYCFRKFESDKTENFNLILFQHLNNSYEFRNVPDVELFIDKINQQILNLL